MNEVLLKDLEASYGIYCEKYEPVSGGWMNKKWKVTANQEIWLVKQFSLQRFSFEKLHQMEHALQCQIQMQKVGVPCPRILEHNGRAIRFADENTVYMVLKFVEGRQETCESITCDQMRSLGATAGLMRKMFDTMPLENVMNYPTQKQDFLDMLQVHYQKCLQDPELEGSYKEAVESMKPIMDGFTLDFFGSYELGIGHEDFAQDNMLFTDKGVAAILDFDRVQYGFKLHDVGRALMSLAFDGFMLDAEKIRAFVDGYNLYSSLTMEDVAAALRIVWCVEMPWWTSAGIFKGGADKILRFRDEVLWLTKHWNEIEDMI